MPAVERPLLSADLLQASRRRLIAGRVRGRIAGWVEVADLHQARGSLASGVAGDFAVVAPGDSGRKWWPQLTA